MLNKTVSKTTMYSLVDRFSCSSCKNQGQNKRYSAKMVQESIDQLRKVDPIKMLITFSWYNQMTHKTPNLIKCIKLNTRIVSML